MLESKQGKHIVVGVELFTESDEVKLEVREDSLFLKLYGNQT